MKIAQDKELKVSLSVIKCFLGRGDRSVCKGLRHEGLSLTTSTHVKKLGTGYTLVIPAWVDRDLQLQGLTGPSLSGKLWVIVRDTASKTPGGRLLGRHQGLSFGCHTKEGFCHFSFIQAPRKGRLLGADSELL